MEDANLVQNIFKFIFYAEIKKKKKKIQYNLWSYYHKII